MAKTPVKQVTITLSIPTRASEKTIKGRMRKELTKAFGLDEIQVLVEKAPDLSSRQARLSQLTTQADLLLAEIEGLVDDGLEELEGVYEAIGEFKEHTEQPEEYDDDTYT